MNKIAYYTENKYLPDKVRKNNIKNSSIRGKWLGIISNSDGLKIRRSCESEDESTNCSSLL